MQAGWRLAINNLTSRWRRSVLLILAVALATGMVFTVSISIGSVHRSIRTILVDMLGAADLRLRHQTNGQLSQELLDEVSRWPEVAQAAPRLSTNVEVLNTRNDKSQILTGNGVVLSMEWQIRPPEILTGQVPAEGQSEIMLDPRAAQVLEAEVGDVVRIGGWGNEIEATVAGICQRMNLGILQTPEFWVDLDALQHAASQAGRLSQIELCVQPGVEPRQVIEAHAEAVPAGVELVLSDATLAGLDLQLKAGSIMYFVSALFCFLAASFIILTGMTTAVSERIRELAMLRCIGANRLQLFVSQLIIGAWIGLLGGLGGIPIGFALAAGIFAYLGDNVREGMYVSPSGAWATLAVAVAAGLVGAALPALASCRVSPLDALRVHARPARRRGVYLVGLIGLAMLLIQVALLRIPDDNQVTIWTYLLVGLPLLVTGWFILAVPITASISWLAAGPLAWVLRLPPDLLRGSVRATPYRHGFTAGALMLGLAAMIAVWSSGRGLLEDWFERIRFPDTFVQSWTGLTEHDLELVRDQPWVSHANPITYFQLPVQGRQLFGIKGISPKRVHVVGFEPREFLEMTYLEWVQGEQESAIRRLEAGGAILVAREFLTARGLGVGDSLTLGPEGGEHTFEIAGVVSSPGLDIVTSVFGIQDAFHDQAIHCVFMTREETKRCFDTDTIVLIQFDMSDTIDEQTAEQTLKEQLGPIRFGTGRRIQNFMLREAGNLMMLASLAAFAAMAVASLGMANVMAANVSARRREYGILRASGAGRWTVTALVLAEALLTGLGACVAGIGLGMHDSFNASYLYRVMVGLLTSPKFPVTPIAIGVAGLLLMALVAAWIPARRIGKAMPCELMGR